MEALYTRQKMVKIPLRISHFEEVPNKGTHRAILGLKVFFYGSARALLL